MKDFQAVEFDPGKCAQELKALGNLLDSKQGLAERAEILGFFRKRHQLSALLGMMFHIFPADRLAYEFPVFGDFAADIVLGSRQQAAYCCVELEDARADSIFKKVKNRHITVWSSRFEHGFSQLVDWFYALHDHKSTDRFAKDFGHGHIRFYGLLIAGRGAGLTEHDHNRLRWRTERVRVDSHSVECLTYDDLFDVLRTRLSNYSQASKFE